MDCLQSSPLNLLLEDQLVGHGSRIERQAVEMADASQFGNLVCRQVQLEQAEHLPIPVLLDHVDLLVSGHKGQHFGEKGNARKRM